VSLAETPVPRRRDERGPRWRGAGAVAVAVGLLVAGVAAWQIVAVAQAGRLAQSAPDEALSWRPADPRALGYLAEREFSDAATSGRSPEQARAAARKALKASPLDVRALRVLAWVAEDEGDVRRARRLMTLAASRSQRDVSSHLWMFHDRLKARDFPAAFAHGDALMRHSGTLREAAVLMASAAGADEAAAKALGQRLQTGPSWRATFVRELSASQDPDVTLSILLAVKEAGSTIADDESSAVAGRLLREGRPREAYLAWVLLLPPAGYDVLGNVYNGGFDGPPGAGPFAWTLQRKTTSITQAPGRSGQALSARAASERELSQARQTLVLEPGVYRLSMDARLDGLSDSGMDWTLSCVGGQVGGLTRLPARKSPDWTPLSTTFTVPGGCEVQRLELRAGGKGGATAWGWFDNVQIEAVGSEG
jgi:hypothetical protein